MGLENRVTKQIVVGEQAAMNASKVTEVASFFSEDGEPINLGGGGGFNDGQRLVWETSAIALANDASATPVTQDFTTLYNPDGSVLLEVSGSDPVVTGFPVGDDFILQRGGADVLWFKTAGLYVVMIDSASVDGLLVQVDYSGTNVASHWQNASTPDSGARGTMQVVVGAVDVANAGLNSGGTLSPYVYNHSGSVQDVWVSLSIMRVN